MTKVRILLIVLMLGFVTGLSWADKLYYLRHRPVQGRVVGGELYIDPERLSDYFEPAELRRIHTLKDRVTVDNASAGELGPGGLVPVLSVAKRLGFVVRSNDAAGIVDIIPPQALIPNSERKLEHATKLDGSKRQEYQFAAVRMKKVLEKLKPYDDPEFTRRIRTIGKKVADVSPLGGLDWYFLLVDTDVPNAACTGEGFVFVTRGLMEMGVTDDELAGVLGHEVAHGVRRHPFKRLDLMLELNQLIIDFNMVQAKVEAADTTDESKLVGLRAQMGQIQKRARSISHRLENMTEYARKDEEEADVLGMRYAVLAGYTEGGLGSCLEKLQKQMVAKFGEAVLAEDLSHPPVERRLKILEKVRSSWHR
ncbi:MAG: M48 family metalloprotease [Candidatus Eremiobacteraeota bacterium]|nr:M48 family metalloprotease [Candidatus Eremiobacteraeota bacterium]